MDPLHCTNLPNFKIYSEICNQVKVVLVDIEGTTTPISFVTKVLFPYAKENVLSYLTNNYGSDETFSMLKSLQEQCKADIAAEMDCKFDLANLNLQVTNNEAVVNSIVNYVFWLMEHDRKVGSLKLLQGKIWKEAYKSGHIKGEVFEDVKPALETLRKFGKLIYIYSSGSVEAQQLLFGYSCQGDMLPLFDGHFDTKIGDKKVKDSYERIANELHIKANEILFLTDVATEADAAIAAGYNVFIVCRPGNKSIQNAENYIMINDFTIFSHCL